MRSLQIPTASSITRETSRHSPFRCPMAMDKIPEKNHGSVASASAEKAQRTCSSKDRASHLVRIKDLATLTSLEREKSRLLHTILAISSQLLEMFSLQEPSIQKRNRVESEPKILKNQTPATKQIQMSKRRASLKNSKPREAFLHGLIPHSWEV
jgi:hypothetical protein